MNTLENYTSLLSNKLSHLSNIADIDFRYSDVLLFRDYQTRLFKWKKALNYDGLDFFNKKKSFHNLFIDISPEWTNQLITEEQVVKDLNILGVKNVLLTFRDYIGFFTCMYLNWEIFKGHTDIQTHSDLPHPYESVFLIICRGGYIFNTERIFEIDNRSYLKYDNKFTLPSIKIDFLDFIDSNCTDFPNQEKVDQLWLEFNNSPKP